MHNSSGILTVEEKANDYRDEREVITKHRTVAV